MGFKEVPDELPSTSLPAQWGKPRCRKVIPEVSPAMVIYKPKQVRHRAPRQNTVTDCRNIEVREADIQHLQSLNDRPISYLTGPLPKVRRTMYGIVPIGAAMHTHINHFISNPVSPVQTACGNLHLPKNDNFTTEQLQSFYKIEGETQDQSSSSAWHNYRNRLITASSFARITKRKKDFTMKFLASILSSSNFQSVPTSYGINNESNAKDMYMKKTSRHVHKCGLVVNPSFPFLGASPDGKVCDNGETGILEIKCPYSVRDAVLQNAVDDIPFLEMFEGNLMLKKQHDYYHQVQGQLLVTGAPFCDFIVYTSCDLFVERILPDRPFINQMLKTLSDFFTSKLKPILNVRSDQMI